MDRALQNAMMGVDSYAAYQQAREVYRKREMALYTYDWDTGFAHAKHARALTSVRASQQTLG